MTLGKSLVKQGSLAKISQLGWLGIPTKKDAFRICWAGNGSECCPQWFLNEYDIKVLIDFKNSIDKEVILLNILWKNL